MDQYSVLANQVELSMNWKAPHVGATRGVGLW